MSRDDFDLPSDRVPMSDLLGNLVLFSPTDYVEEVETINGTKDMVTADLVVLDAEGGPAEYYGVGIFQSALIATLKRKVATGRKVLGVVSKGEAKKGQNAPYIIAAPDEAQQQAARDYLAGRTVAAAVAKDENDPFAV